LIFLATKPPKNPAMANIPEAKIKSIGVAFSYLE